MPRGSRPWGLGWMFWVRARSFVPKRPRRFSHHTFRRGSKNQLATFANYTPAPMTADPSDHFRCR